MQSEWKWHYGNDVSAVLPFGMQAMQLQGEGSVLLCSVAGPPFVPSDRGDVFRRIDAHLGPPPNPDAAVATFGSAHMMSTEFLTP